VVVSVVVLAVVVVVVAEGRMGRSKNLLNSSVVVLGVNAPPVASASSPQPSNVPGRSCTSVQTMALNAQQFWTVPLKVSIVNCKLARVCACLCVCVCVCVCVSVCVFVYICV
jgi:hypothetical protein